MGQEIDHTDFKKRDFALFTEHLQAESALLEQWFQDGSFDDEGYVAGFEAEAWLVDERFLPAPVNRPFLDALKNPLVVPELASFNVELNSQPLPVGGSFLRRMHDEFRDLRQQCNRVASSMETQMVLTGILPTLREEDLSLVNMSDMRRYRALNEQVLRSRDGKPLWLDIHGQDHLRLQHQDVMLEAATTSYQLHLQVPVSKMTRFYNAAQIISAPMVALAANSPYLFGKDLWTESRIPVFEQAVSVAGPKRVGFGRRYFKHILECFQDNRDNYPPLLPMEMAGDVAELNHLRLHNGTIWRWNRPLIGFNQGRPHLRVEHRCLPAGPTEIDAIANTAAFIGMVFGLATADTPPESRLDFAKVRANFYAACKRGLDAEFTWLDGHQVGAQALLETVLIPLAREGLKRIEVDEGDVDEFMDVIEARVRSGHTGSWWQRNFIARQRVGMAEMTAAYVARQRGGSPVHEWSV